MKKRRTPQNTVKEILIEIAALLVELALLIFVYLLGMGLFRLIFGTKFANELLSEPEAAVIIGIIIILLLSMLASGVIYCVQKIKRYFQKKSKVKFEDSP